MIIRLAASISNTNSREALIGGVLIKGGAYQRGCLYEGVLIRGSAYKKVVLIWRGAH